MTALIDYPLGLARFGGHKALYRKYLAQFHATADYGALLAALNAGDAVESARLAHSIKGLAASLALPAMADACLALECAIEKQSGLPEAQSALISVFSSTCQAIEAALSAR